jgi:hypothetical protein
VLCSYWKLCPGAKGQSKLKLGSDGAAKKEERKKRREEKRREETTKRREGGDEHSSLPSSPLFA